MNILYPRRCPVCHQILTEKGILVCRACEDQLHPIIKDYCLKCGRPVAPEVEFCPECRKVHREFDRGRGVFLYNNRMRQSLLHYKYYGSREYGEYYAASICRYMEREIRAWNPDVIFVDFNGMELIKQHYTENPDYYNQLKAVQEGKVYSQISFRSSASNLDMALADTYYAGSVLYPEKFADINPAEKADEIFEKLLGEKFYGVLKENGYEFRQVQIGE